LLGRLGRRFAVHAQSFELNKSPIHDAKKSVVNSRETSQPSPGTPRTGIDLLTTDFLHHRWTLTERELSILRAAGAENDPIILDAINLFNATVAGYSEKPVTQTELNL
jgi:hypothetical protein